MISRIAKSNNIFSSFNAMISRIRKQQEAYEFDGNFFIKLSIFSTKYFHAFIQCTEVRFASFLSSGFTTMAVINQPEKNWQNTSLCAVINRIVKTYFQALM